ncbi:DUF5690 family protein [Zhouia sp. PK063]|uniref:DUF5690 family protein n=1 Tax=Zhouia sp. PK063 TaxID=3373602 RepID=UPI0037A1B1C3
MKSKSNFKPTLLAILGAFGTYFCMYAFRKPFTVATFQNISFWGIDYKILLITAQVLGYMCSKFLGIKIISELKKRKRGYFSLLLIAIAELSLLGFALTPAPYNLFWMFINGLPLGLVWGIVFSYLEGRKQTEFLGLALCSSFIVSSGVVKSVGLFTMLNWGISSSWMPFVTGLLFIIPMLFFVYLLEKIPAPSSEDKKQRTKRVPMSVTDRWNLLKAFWFPILVTAIFYTFLTAFRDFRDNFSRELWDALGFKGNIEIYTLSELPIAILVLISLSFLGVIKQNYKAFITYHFVLIIGVLLTGLATILYQLHFISPVFWMISIGFGLYVCYVPFNCIFFDRMIAAFKIKGNSGFLIYIADSFGYLGSILVMFYRNFGQATISWLHFFIYGTYVICIIGLLSVSASLLYFKQQKNKIQQPFQLNLDAKNI